MVSSPSQASLTLRGSLADPAFHVGQGAFPPSSAPAASTDTCRQSRQAIRHLPAVFEDAAPPAQIPPFFFRFHSDLSKLFSRDVTWLLPGSAVFRLPNFFLCLQYRLPGVVEFSGHEVLVRARKSVRFPHKLLHVRGITWMERAKNSPIE